MITTVCLNPSIDHMLVIDGFAYGGLNRVRDSRYDAGGKGLNVAVTASALGAEAECAGFMFKESARLFETRLRKSGTAYDFVWLDGSARTNFKVFDRERGVVTEFNESGRQVGQADLERMTELVEHRAARTDFLVLSGSLAGTGWEEAFRMGVAGASAMCMTEGSEPPARADFAALLQTVRMERI